jgi:hypothetical protein
MVILAHADRRIRVSIGIAKKRRSMVKARAKDGDCWG